ncbi:MULTISPECIES: recombinase family protein [unclassified Nocardiopsis]|uniref:recombinase family protein n=1 Tax=Nocardiopsis TaxID=2013 RepID=UPI00387A8E2A
MRVAIYIRISTDEERQPFSLEAQETKLRAYIDSQENWHLVTVIPEQASGATTDRPKLAKLLAAARAGRFDLVLVYRVDRFSRSVRGLAHLLDELDSAGVAFRSATEPFDTTTPAGRMMVQMLAVFAEFERATIIDRVINGMERKAARGEWCGGSRPYGYLVDPDTGKLIVKEDEAPLPPRIFDTYVHQRVGAQEIATRLNEHGYSTKNGKPWSRGAILTVLRNRAYLGEVFFRDTYYPDSHPALVDADVFEAAQEILRARGEDHTKRAGNSSDYLMSGLITCPHCDRHYLGNAATGNKYRYRYYTCYSRLRYGKKTCSADRLPADQLEEAVMRALLDVYERSDLVEEAIRAVAQRHSQMRDQHVAERTAVRGELAAAESAIERYLRAFEAGTMPESVCGPRLSELASTVTRLRHRESELSELCESPQQGPAEEEINAMRTQIRQAFANGNPATKKNLVQSLVAEVRITGPRRVQPVFRVPTSVNADPPASTEKVRAMSGLAHPAGFEPAAIGLEVR